MEKKKNHVIKKGDIIIYNNGPKPLGVKEQDEARPWLVVSEPELNKHTPFVWAIPFTKTVRKYPLTLIWDKDKAQTKTYGTLLVNQMTTIDVQNRWTKVKEHTDYIPGEVYDFINAILGI